MINVITGWDRPYRPLQGDHAAALMLEISAAEDTGKVPIHIHLLLDMSGSMESGNKLVEAKKVCRFVIDRMEEEDTLSISAFNDQPSSLVREYRMTTANKENAQKALDILEAKGITRLDLALQFCMDQEAKDKDRPIFVILISDGRPTDDRGKRVNDLAPYFDHAARIGRSGAKLIAVALGDPQAYEADFFNSLAERTGGPFRFSPTADKLQTIIAEDFRTIQNTAIEKVVLNFTFYKSSTKLLWVGRAFPDKQFLEPRDEGFSFSLGALSQDQPQTYIAYIMTTGGDLDIMPGQIAEGKAEVVCQTQAGLWNLEKEIEMQYTADPDLLNFIDPTVNRWRLELNETKFTMNAVNAQSKGDTDSFTRNLEAAKKTRKELGKESDDLDNFRKTLKDDNQANLANLMEAARKSRRLE